MRTTIQLDEAVAVGLNKYMARKRYGHREMSVAVNKLLRKALTSEEHLFE
jgi:hypothetical protein